MSSQKKVTLSLSLLCVAFAIFSFVLFSGPDSELQDVSSGQEAEAIEFSRNIMQNARAGKVREFIAQSRDPKDPGLRESYELLRNIALAQNPTRNVRRSESDGMYYANFMTETGGKILFLLANDNGQWKFIYAMQE
jgi:hypothetical protein